MSMPGFIGVMTTLSLAEAGGAMIFGERNHHHHFNPEYQNDNPLSTVGRILGPMAFMQAILPMFAGGSGSIMGSFGSAFGGFGNAGVMGNAVGNPLANAMTSMFGQAGPLPSMNPVSGLTNMTAPGGASPIPGSPRMAAAPGLPAPAPSMGA